MVVSTFFALDKDKKERFLEKKHFINQYQAKYSARNTFPNNE